MCPFCIIVFSVLVASGVNGEDQPECKSLANISQCANDIGNKVGGAQPIATYYITSVKSVCGDKSRVIGGLECMKKIFAECEGHSTVAKYSRYFNVDGVEEAVDILCDNEDLITEHLQCIESQDVSECFKSIVEDERKMSSDGAMPSDDEMCGLIGRYETCAVDMFKQCSDDVIDVFKKLMHKTIPTFCGSGCSIMQVSLLLLILTSFLARFLQ